MDMKTSNRRSSMDGDDLFLLSMAVVMFFRVAGDGDFLGGVAFLGF
uniref:Uncharacterized protein n=1 Tax=Arundo donax TaxID=35708 RepID=A0A0A9BHI7_ARUDO